MCATILPLYHIPGFPGYRARPDGSIWSCQRSKNQSTYRQLRQHTTASGYLGISTVTACKRTTCIHTLILLAFRGLCPKGQCARHLDGNKHNNHLSNLAWGTRQDNEADKKRHGTTARGEKQGHAKLTEKQVREIKGQRGRAYQEIADEYEVSDAESL